MMGRKREANEKRRGRGGGREGTPTPVPFGSGSSTGHKTSRGRQSFAISEREAPNKRGAVRGVGGESSTRVGGGGTDGQARLGGGEWRGACKRHVEACAWVT